MKGRPALGLAGVSVLVLAGAANAATVAVPTPPNGIPEMVVLAASGERNDVVLGGGRPDMGVAVWTVRDTGAVLTPGESCEAIDEHTVRCALRSVVIGSPRVRLGDMDDRLTTNGGYLPSLQADGGDGHDVMVGGVAGNTLDGGPGDDVLVASSGDGSADPATLWSNILAGGAGNDRLIAGDGRDELHGGGGMDDLHSGGGDDRLVDDDVDAVAGENGPGPDQIDGGPGIDAVSYERRTAPLFVDLADRATDGERGEGDRLTRLESVIGGRGDDRLAGNDRPNLLDGHRGRDRLIGRGGADELRRAEGRVHCGDQRDRVIWHRRFGAFLTPDCELVTLETALFAGVTANPVAASPAALRFRVWCPSEFDVGMEDDVTVRCGPGPLRLRQTGDDRRTLAIGYLPAGKWQGRRITARLTPLGRRLATRRRGVRARVRLAAYFPEGDAIKWTIRLKVPR